MKTVDVNIRKLTVTYINQAIHQLEREKQAMKGREERLRERIADEIRNLADSDFGKAVFELFHFEADGDKAVGETYSPSVTVGVQADGHNVTVVFASGEEVLFVEFGTGVSNNGAAGGSPHPKGLEMIPPMTIGGYGKGNGRKRVWAFYANGQLNFTRGFRAAMPMYNACRTVVSRIGSIA